MLEIARRTGIDQIEHLYESLAQIPEGEKDDLRLPAEVDSSDFGLLPAMVQFVATWIRSGKARNILVPLPATEDAVRRFAESDYTFPLIILNWKNPVINENNNTDIRPDLRKWTKEVNTQMRSLTNVRGGGNQLLLTCFDHLSNHNGLLNCFYSDDTFLPKEDALDFTLIPTVLQVLKLNRNMVKSQLTPIMDDLRGIIYELMKNTDEWARTDRDNRPLNPNIRGLYLKVSRRGKNNVIQNYAAHHGFAGYFNDLEANDNGELWFLELSVFDSGPGFLRRQKDFKGTETINEKVAFLKQCLIKRSTSATGVAAHGKGLGLDRILQILNKKGFLTIRTNELFVYRNLKKDEYVSTQTVEQIQLFDWHTHSADQFTPMPAAAGAALTIIYPLTRLS
jgi:hypothetical protein